MCLKRIIYIALLITHIVFGQNEHTLRGNVVDSNSMPVELGDALLINPNDSTIVKYTYLNDGLFYFDSVLEGLYMVKVLSSGFKQYSQMITLNKNTEISIFLEQNVLSLDETVVTAMKRIFTNKNGNIKINVNGTSLSDVPNSVDLLSKLPRIQVSSDQESISIIGKGTPLIYLNKQNISMDLFRSISVNDIENIEIINNPSSKYEAEGRAVILITLKSNRSEGLKVDISETIAIKQNFNNYFGVNLNAKNNKFEFKGNFEYNELEVWERNGFDFSIQDENIETSYLTEANTKRPQFKVGSGIYMELDEGDYFSINANLRTIHDSYPIMTSTRLVINSNEDSIITKNVGDENGLFFSNNVNYFNVLNELNGSLFIGGQYTKLYSDEFNKISNEFNNSSNLSLQTRNQEYEVDIYTSKVDFEKTFKKDFKVEVGSKISVTDANSALTISDEEQPSNDNQTNFNYSENIYAGYFQLSAGIKPMSLSAGLRFESTNLEGGFADGQEQLIDSTYSNIFPKLSIEIPIDSLHNLSFNYTKNISRPNYSRTNQLNVYLNPFLIVQGNFNLLPIITDEISASLQIGKKTLSASYSIQKNPIYLIPFFDEQQNLLRMIYSNLARQTVISAGITVPYESDFFNTTNEISGIYSKVTDPSAQALSSDPFLYFYSYNQFKFPKGYTFSLSGWALTSRNEGAFEKNGYLVVDSSLSKTFFNKLRCTLSINDIFNTLRYEEFFDFNGVLSDGFYDVDYRGVFLALKYSFGNVKDSSYQNKQIDQEESSRIK